jgi:hypothetical protein
MNIAMETMFRANAARMAGRRPIKSDSEPTVSSAASRLRTYAAKMMVIANGVSPKPSWYWW